MEKTVIYTIYYFSNPSRKAERKFKTNISLFNKFLALLLSVVFIFVSNLFAGMTSLADPKFINYWLLPCVLCINYLLSTVVYHLLLKSKRFNV